MILNVDFALKLGFPRKEHIFVAQNVSNFHANILFANFSASLAHEAQHVLRFFLIFLRNLRQTKIIEQSVFFLQNKLL